MSYQALIAAPSSGVDLRTAPRRTVSFGAFIKDTNASVTLVEVTDLSTDGCKFRSEAAFETATTVWLKIAGVGARQLRVVWREDDVHGGEFVSPMQDQVVRDLAALRLRALNAQTAFSAAKPQQSGR